MTIDTRENIGRLSATTTEGAKLHAVGLLEDGADASGGSALRANYIPGPSSAATTGAGAVVCEASFPSLSSAALIAFAVFMSFARDGSFFDFSISDVCSSVRCDGGSLHRVGPRRRRGRQRLRGFSLAMLCASKASMTFRRSCSSLRRRSANAAHSAPVPFRRRRWTTQVRHPFFELAVIFYERQQGKREAFAAFLLLFSLDLLAGFLADRPPLPISVLSASRF